jgi:hypothetical protein
MLNAITKGSEYNHLYGAPANEDRLFVGIVQLLDPTTWRVEVKKLWDADPVQTYFAYNINRILIFPGEHVICHRVGDFNSGGTTAFELHTENANNYSWVCFPLNPTIAVQDLGEVGGVRLGWEVHFDSAGNPFPTLDGGSLLLRAHDTNYHANTPPWKTGRIYAAVRTPGNPDYFLCYLPGYGEVNKIIELRESSLSVSLDLELDGAGKVVNFGEAIWPFWKFDTTSENWSKLTPSTMPDARYHHSCFVDPGGGDKVYIRGGRAVADDTVLEDIWEYDISANTWTELAAAGISDAARYGHMEKNSGYLYGGFNAAGTKLSDAYDYTPPTTYTSKGSYRPAGRIAEIGTAGYYHPQDGTFADDRSGASWATYVCGGATVELVDFAATEGITTAYPWFIIGGEKLSNGQETDQHYIVEVDDPATPTFKRTIKAKPPVVGRDWDACRDGSDVYLFGGQSAGAVIATTYKYDYTGNSWSTLSPGTSPEARRGHKMVRSPSDTNIYLFGGTTKLL